MTLSEFAHVPVIDVAPLVNHTPERVRSADRIGAACRESGFFYVVNHGEYLLNKVSKVFPGLGEDVL